VPWVAERVDAGQFNAEAKGIGFLEGDTLVAGVVYNHYSGTNVYAHIAAMPNKRWATHDNLFVLFYYPFVTLKCNRITGLVRVDNFKAQRFDEHLGFKREGVMRKACKDGQDLIVYGMLREECRFLKVAHEAV
jgi:RimJ/RimL family protein N-acetyltransferase